MRHDTTMSATRLPGLFAGMSALALLAACASDPTPAELTDEQVCLQHYENDPVERDRCRLTVETRKGAPPDVRPQDLPVRTGQQSD